MRAMSELSPISHDAVDCLTDRNGATLWRGKATTWPDALRQALRSGVRLRGANLSGADLSGADLGRINLNGADLKDANLDGADLSGADLREADLRDANLSGADLRRADLSGADLCGADLRLARLALTVLCGADLAEANLTGADLTGASLSRANLSGAHLSGPALRAADTAVIRDDLYEVLTAARGEVPALKRALREGRVDGSLYDGPCACLIGTIANARQCRAEALGQQHPALKLDEERPAERWFLAIEPDMAETHAIVALTLDWIRQWEQRT